jgi:Cell division protein FtsL.
MQKKQNHVRELILICLTAASVPVLLILDGIQARRYENLSDEVSALEKKQEDLIEDNKQLVTNISVLSSTDRIEKIAETNLGMHKAETGDIVRVEMKGAKK